MRTSILNVRVIGDSRINTALLVAFRSTIGEDNWNNYRDNGFFLS